jgi:hypothetical protein
MDIHEIWTILGIEPTNERKTIKRAYSRLLKQTNPEDDPEGFKRLREAYEKASGLAEMGLAESIMDEQSDEDWQETDLDATSEEEEEEAGEEPEEVKAYRETWDQAAAFVGTFKEKADAEGDTAAIQMLRDHLESETSENILYREMLNKCLADYVLRHRPSHEMTHTLAEVMDWYRFEFDSSWPQVVISQLHMLLSAESAEEYEEIISNEPEEVDTERIQTLIKDLVADLNQYGPSSAVMELKTHLKQEASQSWEYREVVSKVLANFVLEHPHLDNEFVLGVADILDWHSYQFDSSWPTEMVAALRMRLHHNTSETFEFEEDSSESGGRWASWIIAFLAIKLIFFLVSNMGGSDRKNHYTDLNDFKDLRNLNVSYDIGQVFDWAEQSRNDLLYRYLEAGRPANAISAKKWTPLHYAINSNNKPGVIMLMKFGADPNLNTGSHFTPKELARKLGFIHLIDVMEGKIVLTLEGQTGQDLPAQLPPRIKIQDLPELLKNQEDSSKKAQE